MPLTPSTMRVPSTAKAAPAMTLVRHRSSAASTSASMLEARSRVREHARNISRSTAREATATGAVRPAPAPGFQQVPSKNNVPMPPPMLGPHPEGPLDHSSSACRRPDLPRDDGPPWGQAHVGYPGGAILPVFDAIYNSPQFDFVLPRHEQGAGHMAEGYARVTGSPVSCDFSDWLDAFQEADIIGISRSCTKWNVMVKDVAELPRRITSVQDPLPFKATTPGRPSASLEPPPSSDQPTDMVQIERAANLINQAKRPLIYAGAGVLSSSLGPKLLKQLAQQGNIPVTTTLQGLGAFDEMDEKSLHMLAAAEGRGGIIHFEIQPKNINKVVEASIPVLGDVVTNMASLVPLIRGAPREKWFADIKKWKAEFPFTYEKSADAPGTMMKPQEVIEELDRQTADRKEDVVITTGVGQHQMWAAQHYRWRHPRSIVTSGGLGTMGFGLPAAIGAKVGAPNKIVVDIDGDASFSMTAMELQTASQYNIGVKVMVLNNEFQGMVLQWQDLFYDARYAHTRMTNPDFVALARAMGVHAIRVESAAELPAKMKEFLEYDNARPVLLECMVETNEHVFPMVPAGKALHEQILHKSLMGKYDPNGLMKA
ncbi:thiamine diphosphate-binding protein [Fomitopsis serialis]|uniref:thiamine diphosphate-binding protein n=1 Tax=Fomitopsis serialis TaxID=139415 RepID=UPI002007A8E6|nr:thiamine diphosphate-binding protein [Neoantrodia serialis]KAH9917439.1 thiamine diphosphate-binding protein [Neoantrodia serialis]